MVGVKSSVIINDVLVSGFTPFHQNQRRASYQRPAHVDDEWRAILCQRPEQAYVTKSGSSQFLSAKYLYATSGSSFYRPAQTAMFDASPASEHFAL